MKSNKLYNKAAKVFALIPFTLCLLLLLALNSLDSSVINKYSLNGINLNKKFSNENEFMYFLDKMAEIQFSESKAKKEYELCKKYLSDNKVCDNDVIFDLGYSGKLHLDIVKCTGTNPIGAYISKDGYSAMKRIDDNNLNIFSYYSFTPSMQGIVNEYIFSDRAPSCIGYSERNGRVDVEYEDKMNDFIGDYVVNEINRGAFDFVKAFTAAFTERMTYMYMSPLDSSLLYEKFLVSPKIFDKSIFDYCLIEDEYYGGITKRPLTDIWNWQISDRKLEKSDVVQYIDRIVEKEVRVEMSPDNMEWEVYKEKIQNRNMLTKAMYWSVVNPRFFLKRIKEKIGNRI